MTISLHSALERYTQRTGLRLEPRAVFFDMDGVLYDSMPAHARSWQETAAEYGITMTEQDAYRFEGQTGQYTINLLIRRTYGRDATQEEIQKIYERKTELFNRYNTGALIPNAREVVMACSALPRLVVTGSSQGSLLDKLETNFPDTFNCDMMVTGRDVRYGKPHPEPYLMAQAKVGIEPWQSIVIENAPQGVQSAHRAGSFVIAINTGPLPDSELWDEGADLVLANMATLLPLLPELVALAR